jgi:hypothetical protein
VKEYRGGCHCGILKVIYRTAIELANWPLRHDGCSFCRRHGVVGTSDPAGEVAFEIGDASKVRYYRFAQKSAQFMLCGECGVFVAALTETAAGERAVINVRVLDGISPNFNEVTDAHFDDETPMQRAERRLRHWTPRVFKTVAAALLIWAVYTSPPAMAQDVSATPKVDLQAGVKNFGANRGSSESTRRQRA